MFVAVVKASSVEFTVPGEISPIIQYSPWNTKKRIPVP